MIPQYLDEIKPYIKTYGTLEKVGDDWKVEAEPYVLEFVRRIFPATSYNRGGVAMIPHNKRFTGDINWLMMKFPLKILSQDDWKDAHKEAVDYIVQRDTINAKKSITRTPASFKGQLLTFQKQGLTFLYHNKRCLLADSMGLGKTVQALALVSKLGTRPVLIVCPPHLTRQWCNEIKRFLGQRTKVSVISGLTPYKLPESDIYIIHYLLMRGWEQEFIRMDFDVVIFDEVQELRRNTSQKYVSCKNICALRPEYIIGLSGTPFYNYGGEMYNVLNVIENGCLGTRGYFKKEWCGGSWGDMIEKPDLFGSYLREQGLMLRRRKEEVLDDLPEKLIAGYTIGHDDKLYLDWSQEAKELVKELPFVRDDEKGQKLLEIVNSERLATGIAKSQEVAEFVKLLLLNNEPVLLFGYHRYVMGLWAEYLARFNPKFITGKQTKQQKQENVEAFMRGETNLLILNLRTTAGLNLQRARCVVFGELDYSPAVHSQCEDRCHRIGQKNKVIVYYLYAFLSYDEEMMKVLGVKDSQFKGIMHDNEESNDEFETKQVQAKTFMWNMVDRLNDYNGEQK